MKKAKIEDLEFNNLDKEHPFLEADYEYCQFSHCDFSNRDLSAFNFLECTFEHCDFSNTILHDTGFKTVTFDSCKMMGLHFEDCKAFLLAMSFKNCILSFSSFYQMILKGTLFDNCMLEQVDFTETDLSNAILKKCNLQKAIFEYTTLRNADLQTAINFDIDPDINKIAGAKFSTQGALTLLKKYKIVIS